MNVTNLQTEPTLLNHCCRWPNLHHFQQTIWPRWWPKAPVTAQQFLIKRTQKKTITNHTCDNENNVLFHIWMFAVEISIHCEKKDVQAPPQLMVVVVVMGWRWWLKIWMRWDGADSAELDPGARCDEPEGECRMEQGRNSFALKRQPGTAEKRTDLKFDSNDVIGWSDCGRMRLV